jgi:hypothetical protein
MLTLTWWSANDAIPHVYSSRSQSASVASLLNYFEVLAAMPTDYQCPDCVENPPRGGCRHHHVWMREHGYVRVPERCAVHYVVEARAHFGYRLEHTKLHERMLEEWCSKLMEQNNMKPVHIARTLNLVVELYFLELPTDLTLERDWDYDQATREYNVRAGRSAN